MECAWRLYGTVSDQPIQRATSAPWLGQIVGRLTAAMIRSERPTSMDSR